MDIENLLYQLLANLENRQNAEYLYNTTRNTATISLEYNLDQLPQVMAIFYNFSIGLENNHILYYNEIPLEYFQFIIIQFDEINDNDFISTKLLNLNQSLNFLTNLLAMIHTDNKEAYDELEKLSNEIYVSSKQGSNIFFNDVNTGKITINIPFKNLPPYNDIAKLMSKFDSIKFKPLNYTDLIIEALDLRLSNDSSYSNLFRDTYRELHSNFLHNNRGLGINNRTHQENFISFVSKFTNNSFTLNRLLNIKNLKLSSTISNIINNLHRHE